VLSKSSFLWLIIKLFIRRIRLPNFRPSTQTSRKCYQTQKVFKKVPLKFSSSQHYPIYFYSLKYSKHSIHSRYFHHLAILFILQVFQEKSHKKKSQKLFSPSISRPFLPLVLLILSDLRKFSPVIHGLLIFQKPMKIENDLPYNGF
jgi:hypothetical protein